KSFLCSLFILTKADGHAAPGLPFRFAFSRPRRRTRGDAAVLPPGSVRTVRSPAAERAARRHDGDRRQRNADDRRDQGLARRSARRLQVARLSRLLRPLLLGGAAWLRTRSVRG